MSDEPKPADPKPADPAPAADNEVVLSKEEHDNLIKSRDSERAKAKEAEGKLKDYEKTAEERKVEKDRKKAEEEGKYAEVLGQKDEEINKYKPQSERLEKLLEKAEEKNKKDLEKFEDEGDKKLVESAIAGKDALDARELIKGFKVKFLGEKKGNDDIGNGVNPNPEGKQVKLDKIEALRKEFEALADKRRKNGMFNSAEKKRLLEIPAEIKILQGEKDDKK